MFYEGIYKGQSLRLGAMLKPLYRKEFPKPVIVVALAIALFATMLA